MPLPTLSVIIPTRDRFALLQNALDYLNKNECLPEEVIIVDDCSKITISKQILPSSYQFPISIFRNEINKGACYSRNKGIKQASCDLVLLMDDDVYPDSRMIYFHKFFHQKNQQPSYGVCGRVIFDPHLTRTPLIHFLETKGAYRWLTKMDEGDLYWSGILTANVSMKSSFIKKTSLFDESFPFNRNEDTEFSQRLMNIGFTPRFHAAASAKHYAPFTLKNYTKILWQGGQCKAHWSSKDPDASISSTFLSRVIHRHPLKQQFYQLFNQALKSFPPVFFNSDVSQVSAEKLRHFTTLLNSSQGWFIDFGMYEYWHDNVARFTTFEQLFNKAVNSSFPEAESLFSKAMYAASNFPPAQLAVIDHLIHHQKYDIAKNFISESGNSSIWNMTRLIKILSAQKKADESCHIFSEIHKKTNHGKRIEDAQRELAVASLKYLVENGTLEVDKAKTIISKFYTSNEIGEKPYLSWIREIYFESRKSEFSHILHSINTAIKTLR